jgi:hypothetical protein
MNDFRKLLSDLNSQDEQTEAVQIPFAPQATMPDVLAQAAQEEAEIQAPARIPASQPAKPSENSASLSPLPSIVQQGIPESSSSSESRAKTSISGTVPASDKADGSESAEARLERLMRELNEQRNKEREEASSREFKADVVKAITDNIGTFVGGMQAKNSKASVTPVQTKGYDVGDLVAQVDKKFTGDREALLDQYKQLLNARDRSEQRKFQRDSLEIQREGNRIKQQLANQKGSNLSSSLTPGEKKVDETFAKDYNMLTSKGFNNAETSIKRLEQIASELESEGDGLLSAGGGRTSILPDAVRSQDSIRWRDDAANQANATLKELFPGSLSDDERRAAAREFYNDTLGNVDNAKILKDKAAQLRKSLQDQKAKAEYFSQKGTLKGKGPAEATPSDDPRIDSFMQKNGITDRNEAIAILKKAGKL